MESMDIEKGEPRPTYSYAVIKSTEVNKTLLYGKYAFEACAFIAVFIGTAVYYFRQQAISLVPFSQCGKCSECQAMYQLAPLNQFEQIQISVHVAADGTLASPYQYQHMTLFANWTSCGVSEIGYFNMGPLNANSVAEAKFPMNIGGNSNNQWDAPYSYADDHYRAPEINYAIAELSASNIGGAYSNYGENLQNECFRLTCGAYDGFFSSGQDFFSVMQVQATDYQPYVKVQPAINIDSTGKTVTASCEGVIYGNLVTILQSAHSIQLQDAYLCTTNTSALNALSLAFSSANGVYSAIDTAFAYLLKV